MTSLRFLSQTETVERTQLLESGGRFYVLTYRRKETSHTCHLQEVTVHEALDVYKGHSPNANTTRLPFSEAFPQLSAGLDTVRERAAMALHHVDELRR